MNRNALNSAPLGSGNSLPYILASATQVLRLVGTAAGYVAKYAKVTQSMALTASVTAINRVFMALSSTLAMSYSASSRVFRNIYVVISQPLNLHDAVVGTRKVVSSLAGTLALVGTPVVNVWRKVQGTLSQVLRLSTSIIANDFTTTPAPLERTTSVVSVATRETPPILIGD